MPLSDARRANLLRLFGLLDALLFVRFIEVLAVPFWTHRPAWVALFTVAQGLIVVSLALSAYGFFRGRDWAFVLYYVHFPLRVAYAMLSFGFLTYVGRIVGGPLAHWLLLIVAILLELVRLVLTIRCHKSAMALREGILPSSTPNYEEVGPNSLVE